IRDRPPTIRTPHCPVWATLGQQLPRTRGRRRRASIPRAPTSTAGCSTGFVGRRLEPIASCPLGEAMDWGDEGIFLSAKPLGEANIVAEIFNRAHGRHLGLVRGGRPRRAGPRSGKRRG